MRAGTSHIFAYRNYGAQPATIGATTTPMRGIGVVGDYFGGLGGVPLVMGRAFEPDSDEPVAVIGYWVWQQQFGGAPDVLGRTLTLGTVVFTVVGVAREDFLGTQPDLRWDLIAPFRVLNQARGIAPAAIADLGVFTVVRLEPGVSAAQYQARIAPAWPSLVRATIPAGQTFDQWLARRGSRLVVDPLSHGQAFTLITTPGLPRALHLTAGLSLLIFLASCVTLALLVVARAVRNQRNTAIRQALGGSRWRIVRPQVLEAALASLLGCVGGLLLARWGSDMAKSFVPGDWPIAVTASSVIIALAMAAGTTVLAGSLAAYLSARGSVRDVLQQSDRTSRPHVKLRAALLMTQLAVAVVLVHSTLLYVDDLHDLAQVETGINVENLHVYSLAGRLPQRNLGREYFQPLVAELSAIPGAQSVGLGGGAPPLGYIRDVTERVQADDGREINAVSGCVFPGAFQSWGTQQLSGRDLAWTDGPATVVTDSLARRLYPNQSPIGKLIRREGLTARPRELQIVGIVENMAYNGLRLGLRDVAFISCLERTNPWPSSFVVQVFIRSERNLAELGKDVSRVVERLGTHFIYGMEDQEQYVAWSVEREEMLATLSTAFGGLILLTTGVGLYAFCNYMLTFRNHELAIRSSLGASPHDIASTLLRETLTVLVVGMTLGLVLSLVLTRLAAGFVVDLGSITFVHSIQAVIVLLAVASAAAILPTFRALRLDVARSLRVD
jgi:predicted permease